MLILHKRWNDELEQLSSGGDRPTLLNDRALIAQLCLQSPYLHLIIQALMEEGEKKEKRVKQRGRKGESDLKQRDHVGETAFTKGCRIDYIIITII
jgi:hypothetical protein